eukprot:7286013-Karenia_brevis.AAC.1
MGPHKALCPEMQLRPFWAPCGPWFGRFVTPFPGARVVRLWLFPARGCAVLLWRFVFAGVRIWLFRGGLPWAPQSVFGCFVGPARRICTKGAKGSPLIRIG